MGAAAAARPVVTGTGEDLGLHLEGLGPAVDGGPQVALGSAGGLGDEGAQDDAATGDDLLDVDDVDGVGGEGVEQPGGDPGTVLAEDLDEEGGDVGGLRCAHGALTVSSRLPGQDPHPTP